MNIQFKNSRPAIKWMSQRALTTRSVEILRKEHRRILKDGDEVCGARVIVDDVMSSARHLLESKVGVGIGRS